MYDMHAASFRKLMCFILILYFLLAQSCSVGLWYGIVLMKLGS